MPNLDSFTNKEAYSNQVEIPGIASIIHEDPISQATYGNHCELSATTILAVYRDVTNSKGMLRIGTRVSDFAIEWGTPVEFLAGNAEYIIPVRVSDTKFAIVFRDYLTNGAGWGSSIAGTVAGTVPTLGALQTFNSAATIPIGAVLMDTDKVMIAFANSSTNGQCVIASLTGTSIAYGAIATFKATTAVGNYNTLTQLCRHSTTLASVVYRVDATITEVVTLSFDGNTTITPNTAGKAAIGGSADIRYPSIGALDATKFVVAYTDVTDTNKGNAQIGTISGTTITAGASEYAFDTANAGSRVPMIAIISSTLFAVSYVNGTNVLVKVGSVSSTAISYGTVCTIEGQIYLYPAWGSYQINLTYTKSGQLTFSYLTSSLNQFICGMLTQNYKTLEAVPMCVKVAEALTGEQIELSSVYLKANGNGFKNIATIITSLVGNLYHNGTLQSNTFATTSDSDLIDTAEKKSFEWDKANNPIILTAGQSLYASIDTNQGTSPKKGSCTVFGLKRSA